MSCTSLEDRLRRWGFSDAQIQHWAKSERIFSARPAEAEAVLGQLESFGFTRAQIITLTVSYPRILSYKVGTAAEKLEYLLRLQQTSSGVIELLLRYPQILGKQKEEVAIIFGIIRQLDWQAAEHPSIFTFTSETLKDRLRILREHEVDLKERPGALLMTERSFIEEFCCPC